MQVLCLVFLSGQILREASWYNMQTQSLQTCALAQGVGFPANEHAYA